MEATRLQIVILSCPPHPFSPSNIHFLVGDREVVFSFACQIEILVELLLFWLIYHAVQRVRKWAVSVWRE